MVKGSTELARMNCEKINVDENLIKSHWKISCKHMSQHVLMETFPFVSSNLLIWDINFTHFEQQIPKLPICLDQSSLLLIKNHSLTIYAITHHAFSFNSFMYRANQIVNLCIFPSSTLWYRLHIKAKILWYILDSKVKLLWSL